MNRLASREPATTAVATWPMPSSSANATDASISARPTPCRRNSGKTCGEMVWTTGSRLSGVMVAARRCTAPASLPSYSATTSRSSWSGATRSMIDRGRRPAPRGRRAAARRTTARPAGRRLGHGTAQGHQVTRHGLSDLSLVAAPLCPRARPHRARLRSGFPSRQRRPGVPRYRHRRQRGHGSPRSRPGRAPRQPAPGPDPRRGDRRAWAWSRC